MGNPVTVHRRGRRDMRQTTPVAPLGTGPSAKDNDRCGKRSGQGRSAMLYVHQGGWRDALRSYKVRLRSGRESIGD